MFGLIEGERYDWDTITGPVTIPSVIALGVVLLVVFVLWQRRRRDEPLMPPALSGARNFAVGNGVGFVFQLGMIGIMFVLVLCLQMARGYSALETGLVVLPNGVLTAADSAYAGRLSDKFGGKYILMAGMTLLAAGLLVLVAMAGPTSSVWNLLPGLSIIGIAGGATFAPLQQATAGRCGLRRLQHHPAGRRRPRYRHAGRAAVGPPFRSAALQSVRGARRPEPSHDQPVRAPYSRHVRHRLRPRHADHSRGVR
ncbi:MFS transporter [Actinomadura violacea]|uniref:MFS transporter n=1 Tax=Actinomadura violacea TaxID=2819934 RepID=A0ABS3RJR9_9ACTN|nr:MFS transporter [Actinomadura violacea]MBO2456902.1 MFS transporter [Actinomadura violacea]